MKKKIVLILTALACVTLCAFSLTACGSGTVKIEFEFTLNKDGASYAVTGATYDGDVYQLSKMKGRMPEEVTVPAEHDGKPVTVIKTMSSGTDVKKVNLPDSIVEIGKSAFVLYSELTSIKIGKNVETIGESAFQDLKNLETIEFEENSKLKLIGKEAFSGSGLKSFKAPAGLYDGYDPGNYTPTERMFKDCKNLETIDFGAISVSRGVQFDIDFATGCTALKTVIVPQKSSFSTAAFDKHNKSLTTVYSLEEYPFGEFKIGFFGAKDDLGNWDIGNDSCLSDVYCYSETTPDPSVSSTVTAWHYVDGVPTKW